MIATSGLVSRIQACDFSKPQKIRFQYGSSVFLLSIAAPMAGTCDEPIPATILATASLPFRSFGFGLGATWLCFDSCLALGPAAFFAAAAERYFDGAFLPERERLPSTDRPPPSIMLA